jgi:osmotically-inducible protein OsmY
MKSDVELRTDVEEELSYEPSVDAAAIGVAVKDGIVTLSGHVASYAEKVAAEQAATRVLGVNAIVTDLDVKLPGSRLVNDEDIARAAVDALSWNTLIPSDRIKVQVGSGWLTLEGDVDWHYQKSAAYSAVCNLKGVRGISNQISIKPVSIHDVVEAHIESALKRRFGKRRSRIKVETRRDHVTLWGTVNSMAESAEAERAAWTTQGVCHVENHLSIAYPGAYRRSGGAGGVHSL